LGAFAASGQCGSSRERSISISAHELVEESAVKMEKKAQRKIREGRNRTTNEKIPDKAKFIKIVQ
jgi:hypothetical protein